LTFGCPKKISWHASPGSTDPSGNDSQDLDVLAIKQLIECSDLIQASGVLRLLQSLAVLSDDGTIEIGLAAVPNNRISIPHHILVPASCREMM
jgi:hypothetical protein